MNGNYVYAIGRKSGGPIKVGKASDVKKRLSGLQTSHHEKLVILQEWYRPKGDAVAVEQMAHGFLEDQWLNGEWFEATLEQVCAAVERAMNLADIPRERRFAAPPTPAKKGPSPEEIAWAKANPGVLAKEILKWNKD